MDLKHIAACSHVLVFCANTNLSEQAKKIIKSMKAADVLKKALNSMKWLQTI